MRTQERLVEPQQPAQEGSQAQLAEEEGAVTPRKQPQERDHPTRETTPEEKEEERLEQQQQQQRQEQLEKHQHQLRGQRLQEQQRLQEERIHDQRQQQAQKLQEGQQQRAAKPLAQPTSSRATEQSAAHWKQDVVDKLRLPGEALPRPCCCCCYRWYWCVC